MPEEDLQYIGRTIKEVVPRDNTVIYRGQGLSYLLEPTIQQTQ